VATVERLTTFPSVYTIAVDAMAAVRRHANLARPGHEIGGELVVEGSRILRYEPQGNLCSEEGWYEPPRLPPAGSILLHSHPQASPGMSHGDLDWMLVNRVSRIAIFAPDRDCLLVWALVEGEEKPRAAPVRIERRPGRRLPPRRPGRRW
jgi:hypothetical protein